MASWRHENKEYFDNIRVSVVYSICSSCYYCIGFDGTCGFRYWANFLAVLDDFVFGFAVSNTLQCPPRLHYAEESKTAAAITNRAIIFRGLNHLR